MPEVHVFLVEDELIHSENALLSIEEAGFKVAGTCDHADKALDEIVKTKPDVVLMDISLPGKHNGITLAQKLKDIDGPPVIFTTSFNDSETIQEAAATGPVSYLVKPVDTDNLKAAVTLALNQRPVPEDPEIKDGAIFIKSGNKLHKVLIPDILWIESAGDNYCKVVTATQQLISRHTVKSMVTLLDSDDFVQTHRAYVVNMHKIDSIHEKEQVLSIGEHEVPIGRTYKEALYHHIRRF